MPTWRDVRSRTDLRGGTFKVVDDEGITLHEFHGLRVNQGSITLFLGRSFRERGSELCLLPRQDSDGMIEYPFDDRVVPENNPETGEVVFEVKRKGRYSIHPRGKYVFPS